MSAKSLELGTLIVVILKARNLNDKHSIRKQDAFAQATLNGMFLRISSLLRCRQLLIRSDKENTCRHQGWPAPRVGCRITIRSFGEWCWQASEARGSMFLEGTKIR